MKLHELFTENFPDPHDVLDSQKIRQDMEAHIPATDTRFTEKQPKTKPSRKDSNLAKARRIRTLARLKVRDTVKGQEHEDTNHTYNLGGHVSTFLNR